MAYQATLSQHETFVDIANDGAGGKVALWSLKRYGLYNLSLRFTNTSYFHYLWAGGSISGDPGVTTVCGRKRLMCLEDPDQPPC